MTPGPEEILRGAAGFARQSTVTPVGTYASSIYSLAVLFFVVLGLVYLIVMALAILPVLREKRGDGAWTEKRLGAAVGLGTAVTVLILFGLVVVSVSAGKAIAGPTDPSNAIVVEITGQQWWWTVRYVNDDPRRIVQTANEMHIPVGRPVMIRGTSRDVIHSFWVPNLQGKRDLIPSRVTTEWLQADRPGRVRGQCTEFCGLQHAHMAMWVVAETPEDFERWLRFQAGPSVPPTGASEKRGQEVFLQTACALCHTISGTPAAGQVGPDLTHFGSRLTIGAGALPNNKSNLASWIADPHKIKPGTHMPGIPLPPGDVQPLSDYLESLH